MTRPLFAACVLLSASRALAQTPAPAPPAAVPGNSPKTVTMTGCVGGQGSDAQPFMLNNAFVVPSGTQPMPDPTGAAATQPSAPTPTPTTPPPVVSPTVPPPATSAPPVPPATPTPPSTPAPPTTATSPATPAAPTAPAGAAGAVGTAGTVPSGVSSAAMNGYRLSGSDMKPWAGQRVEIVGSLINANPAGATAAVPEFRVQSVRPVTGSCPQ